MIFTDRYNFNNGIFPTLALDGPMQREFAYHYIEPPLPAHGQTYKPVTNPFTGTLHVFFASTRSLRP